MAPIKKKLTCVILGGNGLLGNSLQKVFISLGVDFLAPTREMLDLTDQELLLSYLNRVKPSFVVNCAAWTDVDSAESNENSVRKINTNLPMSLVLASLDLGFRLIQISTDYVFSGIRKEPWTELDVPSPLGVYGKSKAEAEEVILKLNPTNSVIIRTAWLYGITKDNFAKKICRKIINLESEIEVVADQFGQPTLVTDLAFKIAEVVLSEIPAGIYHGTNGGSASWFDFAQSLVEMSGYRNIQLFPISRRELDLKAERPQYTVLGHDNWCSNGLSPIRNWEIALHEVFPILFDSVLNEVKNVN